MRMGLMLGKSLAPQRAPGCGADPSVLVCTGLDPCSSRNRDSTAFAVSTTVLEGTRCLRVPLSA